MGSWSCYCAICGGPFGASSYISRKPRTARFHQRQLKAATKRRERHLEPDADVSSESEPDDDDEQSETGDDQSESDEESLDAWDEDRSYDPDIISAAETEWTEKVHILGFNPRASGVEKAFVAGPGYYADYGSIEMHEEVDDPNWNEINDYAQGLSPSCYYTDTNDPIFPFHWCCYELLAKCLTDIDGSPDDVDKDLLYNIMLENVGNKYAHCLEKIQYGWVLSHGQFWEAKPGLEFTVARPTGTSGVKEAVQGMLDSQAFGSLSLDMVNLEDRVQKDRFKRLSYGILHRIFTILPTEDVLSFAAASWPVHVVLRDNTAFWRQRIKMDLPWFNELHEILAQDETLLESVDVKRMMLWVNKVSDPRMWMRGPLMSLANRRRIWAVCEQFKDQYAPKIRKWEENSQTVKDVDKFMGDSAVCLCFPVVSAPASSVTDSTQNAVWFRSWDDIDVRQKTIETFWDDVGSLVGISLSREGESRRLLGRDQSTSDGLVHARSVNLGDNNEIEGKFEVSGIILHIPRLSFITSVTRNSSHMTNEVVGRVSTAPKGVTVSTNALGGHLATCQLVVD